MTAAPLTAALAGLTARNGGAWTGTATDLQAAIAADLPPDLASLDASRFSSRLRADMDTLAAAGIEVQPPDGGGRSGRIWTICAAIPRPEAPPIAAEAMMSSTADTTALAAARSAVTAALLAGQDSRPARAVLSALEDRAAREAAAEAAAAAKIQQQRQAAINGRATQLAAAAAADLAATLAVLEPPPPVAFGRGA